MRGEANEYDTVTKPRVVIATIVVPALVVLLIATIVLDMNAGRVITEKSIRENIVTATVVECCVVSFLIYVFASRTAAYQKRDFV